MSAVNVRTIYGLFLVVSLNVACGGSESSPSSAVSDAEDLTAIPASSFVGSYDGTDTSRTIDSVRIESAGGSRLRLVVNDSTYPLTKVRPSTFVFDSGELDDECDDPGCSVLTNLSGVVYVKAGDLSKTPRVKLTEVRKYLYPEFEGDTEGERTIVSRLARHA